VGFGDWVILNLIQDPWIWGLPEVAVLNVLQNPKPVTAKGSVVVLRGFDVPTKIRVGPVHYVLVVYSV